MQHLYFHSSPRFVYGFPDIRDDNSAIPSIVYLIGITRLRCKQSLACNFFVFFAILVQPVCSAPHLFRTAQNACVSVFVIDPRRDTDVARNFCNGVICFHSHHDSPCLQIPF